MITTPPSPSSNSLSTPNDLNQTEDSMITTPPSQSSNSLSTPIDLNQIEDLIFKEKYTTSPDFQKVNQHESVSNFPMSPEFKKVNQFPPVTTCIDASQSIAPKSSLSSVFSKLQFALFKDSTWTPKIIINMPSFLFPKIDKTDLVDMLKKPPIDKLLVMQQSLDYPEGTSFEFIGYDGLESRKKLVRDIKVAALRSSGTVLTVSVSNPSKRK